MKIPAIDVLRGLAALGVVWFHSRVDLWVGFHAIQANSELYTPTDRLLSWLSLPASQMGSLVMLFFVLSGFCIHLPLAGKQQKVALGQYAVRRGLRIYPAYLAILIFSWIGATFLTNWFEAPPPELSRYLTSGLLAQNWISGGQVLMNPSLWSIPVEVELYLVYPLLLWIHIKFGFRASLIFTLICTGIGWALHFSGSPLAFGSFFKYAIIWNSGAWLAEFAMVQKLPKWTRWHMISLLGALTVTPLAGLLGTNIFYLHYGWGLTSFLGLWWFLADGSRFLPADASWVKILVGLGAISYSLYLIHFPLFRIWGILWVEWFGAKPGSFLVPCLATLAVIPFAWLFYRLFEKPSHQWARTLGKRIGGAKQN